MHCFGYTFPFKVFCEKTVEEWEPIKKFINNSEITAYPPFLSEAVAKRSSPSFEYGKSPALSKRGIETDKRDLGLVVLPTFKFNIDGSTGAFLAWTEDPDFTDYEIRPCNAIQIDIEAESEDKAFKTVDYCHRIWLREIRRLTKQYWIGFFPSYFESNLRAQFEVDEEYALKSEPLTHARFTTPGEEVVPATEGFWKNSWTALKDEPFPSSLDHLLDGQHFAASGDKYRAVISLATCIERSKYSIWEHLYRVGICGSNDYKNAMNDTSKPERYFSSILEARTGRNLRKDDADLTELIEAIWIVRGRIAHGRENEIPQKNKWLMEEENLLKSASLLFKMLNFVDDIISMHKV